MDSLHLSRTQNLYWSGFLGSLLALILISAVSPLPLGILTPVTGLIFFCFYKPIFFSFPQIDKGILISAGAGIALFLISSQWAIDPEGLHRAGKISAIVLGSSLFISLCSICPAEIWRRYIILFPLATMCLGLLSTVDLYSGMKVFRFVNHLTTEGRVPTHLINKNISVFTLLLPVSLYLAWKGRSVFICLALLGLAMAIFFKTQSQASQLAMLIMPLAWFGISPFLRKLTMRSFFASLVLFVVLAPWLVPIAFNIVAREVHVSSGVFRQASIGKRLEAWDFISRRIHEKPLLGYGMDSTRHMRFDSDKIFDKTETIMHPHNAALQIWIDFGLVGAVSAIAFLIFRYCRMKKADPEAYKISRSVPFVTFCGIVTFLLVSWSIWASWLIGFIFYLSGLLILAAKTNMTLGPEAVRPFVLPVDHDRKTHPREPGRE